MENYYWLKVYDAVPVMDASGSGVPPTIGIRIQVDPSIPLYASPVNCGRSFLLMTPEALAAKFQNEVADAILDIMKNMPSDEKRKLFGSEYSLDMLKEHTGSEIMDIYNRWKKKKKQEANAQIQAAIELLRSNGYTVTEDVE